MRAAGYQLTDVCSADYLLKSKLHQDCMKKANEHAREDDAAKWYQACQDLLENEWSVGRLLLGCYQSDSWWRRWLGQ
jgi:hypothetical protein